MARTARKTPATSAIAASPPVPEAKRRGRPKTATVAPPAPPPPKPPNAPEPKGKIGVLVVLLRRPEGASLPELTAATGWQAHSVRGAIAGSIKKTLRLEVLSEASDAGRRYRISPSEPSA